MKVAGPYRERPSVDASCACEEALGQALAEHADEPSISPTWEKISSRVVALLAARHISASCSAMPDMGPQAQVVFKVYIHPPMRSVKCRAVVS